MKAFLQRDGISLSKTTVHKYMNRELQLHSICRRKRPAYHRGLAHKIFPNLLKRNYSPERPNRVWCTDFTYMTLTNGTMRYSCSIIDLYDRSVVASENSPFITSSLAVRTLEKSVVECKGDPTKPDFALGSKKSVYFRRVCTTLPEARDFSKHEPCGLSE